MALRLRKQRHRRSCGLACVATIANVPYNTVLEDFENWVNESDESIWWIWSDKSKRWLLQYGTGSWHLHKLLEFYGVKSNKKCTKFKGDLPDLSILAINVRHEVFGGRKRKSWHWVVCERVGDSFQILDPYDGETKDLSMVDGIDSFIRIHT